MICGTVSPDIFQQAMMMLSTGESTEGLRLIKISADNGDPRAMNIYAKALKDGDIVERDVFEAHRYFVLAAEQGVDEAQYYVGMGHFLGLGARQSFKDAIKWFRVSAEKGFPKAQYAMGQCYLNGYGVYRDIGFAKLWFTMAADKEYSTARIALGDIYMDLHNPGRDYKEAARLYTLAADAGDVDAYYKIAHCYHYGKGVPLNQHKAAQYFEKGCREGDRECIFMLGQMYEKGQGVREDKDLGRQMIEEASRLGSVAARSYLMGKLPNRKQTSIIVNDVLDTPDVVAGFKGAEEMPSLFGRLKKKKKVASSNILL